MILNIVISIGIKLPMYFINLWPGLHETSIESSDRLTRELIGRFLLEKWFLFLGIIREMNDMIPGNPIKISWQPYLLLSGCLYFFLSTVGLVVNKNSKWQSASWLWLTANE